MIERASAWGRFSVVCYTHDGWVCWRKRFDNLWTSEGKNAVLDGYFGGTALAALYVGLITDTSYTAIAAGDTAAQIGGSNGWLEAGGTNAPVYLEAARPTLTLAAASGGTRATASAALFTVTSAGTVKGGFTIGDGTKDGTTGPLISAGLFNEGDQAVVVGNVLAVSWTGGL